MRFQPLRFPERRNRERSFRQRICELGTDGACSCICRVGCAHDFAVFRDSVFAFQNLSNDRRGCHELAQFVVERTLGVHFVELTRLSFGQVDALLSNDAQASFFELGVDFAGQVAAGCIGLDDREGAFQCHRAIS